MTLTPFSPKQVEELASLREMLSNLIEPLLLESR